VAGLDAGLAYNTWPMMDGKMIPSGLWVMDPAWLNAFENSKTVQFIHRTSAYAVLLAILCYAAFLTLKSNDELGRKLAFSAWFIFALTIFQAMIGIGTLLLAVPLDWALAHQGGAVILLAAIVTHTRATYPPAA
jgi:cytochrome c oxidase assembly protein subunit 15